MQRLKMVLSLSELSNKVIESTSKQKQEPALMVLEDGTKFYGKSCGVSGEAFGEVCFNTSLEGYFEVITDPSYAGQILIMTYPQIGNYGVCKADSQRKSPALRALVVRDMCHTPSNWRSPETLPEYLRENNVVAIEGIDTRALVRHIRENGAMRAGISTLDLNAESLLSKVKNSDALVGENFVKSVSSPKDFADYKTSAERSFALKDGKAPVHKVVAYDCGAKTGIVENLVLSGMDVQFVPWDTPAEDVLALNPDGVFLSNGPGDPDAVQETFTQVEKLLGKVNLFGICLGHQMLCKAAGADMEKLPFGHHGGNHPVMNLLTGRVEITSQNHGFGVIFETLGDLIPEQSGGISEHFSDLREWAERSIAPVVNNPKFGRIRLTHVNLNDGTPEGIAFLDVPAFSVQYHPEASPGPTDSHYLFTAFSRLMDNDPDYLDIDIANDRCEGWVFSDKEASCA